MIALPRALQSTSTGSYSARAVGGGGRQALPPNTGSSWQRHGARCGAAWRGAAGPYRDWAVFVELFVFPERQAQGKQGLAKGQHSAASTPRPCSALYWALPCGGGAGRGHGLTAADHRAHRLEATDMGWAQAEFTCQALCLHTGGEEVSCLSCRRRFIWPTASAWVGGPAAPHPARLRP